MRTIPSTPPKFPARIKDLPEYNIWTGIRSRCQNKNGARWKDYGGRGIVVCERWKNFANFYNDMGPRPTKEHSIDRINNTGNYEPENCRWATRKQQCRNARGNTMVEWRGETKCMAEWEDTLKMKNGSLKVRLRRGWTIERALTVRPRKFLRKLRSPA